MAENPFLNLPTENVSSNPFLNLPDDEAELAPQQEEDPEYEGAPQEFIEGLASGTIGIFQGIGELAGMGIDAIADTDTSSAVTEIAEEIRDAAGIDPAGIIGKGTELVTQFVIPGGLAGRAVHKAAMAARKARGLDKVPMTFMEKTGLAAKDLSAAGLADAVVTNSGMNTVADFFEGGYTQTNQTSGLQGRAEAARRFENRLKVGAEAIALGGVIGGVLKGAGTIAKGAADTTPGQATLDALKAPARKLADIENRYVFEPESLNSAEKFAAELVAGLRPRSFLPEEVATRQFLIDSRVQPALKQAERNLKSLNTNLDSVLKGSDEATAQERDVLLNQINEYVTAPIKTAAQQKEKDRLLSIVPRELRPDVEQMRGHVDELTNTVLNSSFLKDADYIDAKTQRRVTDVIQDNIGGYLRRRYRIYEDDLFTPGETEINAAREFYKGNSKSVEFELNKLESYNPDALDDATLSGIGAIRDGKKIKLEGAVNDDAAKLAQESFLKRHKLKASREGTRQAGFVAKNRLNTGMFVERQRINRTLRALLGEVKDPQEAYLGTISDLAQFTAVDDFFGTVKNMADNNEGIGKFFINPKNTSYTPSQLKEMVDSGKYVELGSTKAPSTLRGSIQSEAGPEALDRSGWGSLNGIIVPSRIHKDLSNFIVPDENAYAGGLRRLYGSFLKAKGVSQYSKTVLSPITQIRNFTTATMFALSQGNIGRGANLFDSIKMVFDDATAGGNENYSKLIDEMSDRGVVGTNTELREIQDLIRKGDFLETTDQPKSAAEALGKAFLGKELGAKVADSKLARGGGKALRAFEKAYQGSDDVFKAYNYQFEKNKLRTALNGLTDEEKVKYLTKNMTDVDLEKATAIQNGMPLKARRSNRDGTIDDLNLVDELIKDRAGQIVRDTVPNYNKAPLAIRALRRLPVGNFVTFPYEIYRTGANTLKQALDEINSDIAGVRAIGQRRMLGFMGTTAVLPQAMLGFAYAVSGVSRDEMKAYQRSFSPTWEKAAMLAPVGKDEEGNLTYVNLSTSNPYDTLYRMITAANNSIGTDGKLDKPVDEIMANAVDQSITEFFSPFMSQSMLTEALLDIYQGKGRTSTGAEIFNPEDTDWVKKVKSFNHIFETVLPNVIPVQVTAGRFEPSQFLRGTLGQTGLIDTEDKLGRERTAAGQLARLTGFSSFEFDPKRSMKFAATRMSRAQTDAKRMFNTVTDDANADRNTFINAYADANAAKLRVDKEYYQVLEDAQTLGLSKKEISKVFKENKIGGIDGVMRGLFQPFNISKDSKQKSFRAGTLDELKAAFPEIKRMRKEAYKIPLAPDPVESTYIPLIDKEPDVPTVLPQAPSSSANPFDSLDVPSSRNPFLNLPTLPTLPPGPTVLPNPQDQEIQRRLNP
tara:strand:+ start:1005 stop:5168 length:4164 start_codon:yes stop_codon:yes gene_type:complete